MQSLEDGLVLYSPSDSESPKKDINSTDELSMEELFDQEWIPYLTSCDLTCFNEKTGSLVILELKTEKADHKTFGQLLHYLLDAEVVEYANEKNVNGLRGIILASEIDKSLKDLVNHYKDKTPKISLHTYEQADDNELLFDCRLSQRDYSLFLA